MAQETITIKFVADDDKKLISAFNNLASAQGKFNQQSDAANNTATKLNKTLVDMTFQIKQQGKSWKQLGIDSATVKKAFEGNRLAIHQMKEAMDNASFTTRILGGSFAVLRSKILIFSFAVGLVKQSVGALTKVYDDFDRASMQIETTIRTTGGAAAVASHQIKALAAELQETTNVSDTVVLNAAAMMLTFTQISGDIFPRAIKSALDLSVAFGQDLKSSVIQLGKALNDPARGLNALRRIGISFTKEQKELIAGFLELNDLASAQAVILEELEVEFGNVAAAMAATDVGAWNKAWNTWVDVAKRSGEGFAFILKPIAILAGWLGKSLVAYNDWIAGLSGKTEMKKQASQFDLVEASSKKFFKTFFSLSKPLQQQLRNIGISATAFNELKAEALKSDDAFKKYQKTVEEWNKKIQNTITLSTINEEATEKHRKKIKDLHIQMENEATAEFNKELEEQIAYWYANERAAFAYGEALMEMQPKFKGFQSEFLGLTEIQAERAKKSMDAHKTAAVLFTKGMMTQAESLKWLAQREKEIDAEMIQHKVEHYAQQAQLATAAFSGMTSAMSANVNARMKMELDELKTTTKYKRASSEKKKELEKGVTDGYAKERTRVAKFEKASSFAEAGISIALAITKALPNIPLAVLIGAMGAVQLGAIATTPIPKFARGGMVGGRRHSSGGTMIEAEQGEFIMSRNAVNSVGLEAMNRINAGGGGGSVNISFEGNVMSQDFIEDEAIPMIKEAIRRGADIGVA